MQIYCQKHHYACAPQTHAAYPIVSEERVATGEMPDISGGAFWVVDPLDGAHEFIKKSGCFADGKPLLYDAKDLYTQPYIALSPALAKIQAKA